MLNRRSLMLGAASAGVGLGLAGCVRVESTSATEPANGDNNQNANNNDNVKAQAAAVNEEPPCPCDEPPPADAKTPLNLPHLHVCAFHVARENPEFQISTHHYCSPYNEELNQCVLYDAKGTHARLIGIEYIVPDSVYQRFNDEEKKLWHPHGFELAQGLLVFPDLNEECEEKTVKALMPSWGKVWHTWPDPSTPFPMGQPILMWSANAPGEIRPELIRAQEEALGYKTEDVVARRAKYLK